VLPVYVNSREVFAGLTVSDLARAAVLAPLNLFLVGDTGTGKSKLAEDFYRHWFGGNKAEGGEGVFMRAHPDIDVYHEIFTRLNLSKAQREMTTSLDALVYDVDEINRAPPVAQNQFFGLGDGKMDFEGREIVLGRKGYMLLLATANIGNGEFQGTFETDKAMLNRLHVALDLEYEPFQPTIEDKIAIRKRKASPNGPRADLRNISGKIIAASEEIGARTTALNLETRAALDYLEFGLQNCQRHLVKDRVWPMACQDCTFNGNGEAVCSMVKAPAIRTLEVVRKYAAALKYLAELKNPDVRAEPHEFVFKAFELTGAYQHLLNPADLRKHYGHNPKAMAEATAKLKEDYEAQRDYILTTMSEAEKGNRVARFFLHEGDIGNYDALSEKAKAKTRAIEPFTNAREVGLGYVKDIVELTIEGKKPEVK
jgi:hypothetical protein